MTKDGNRKNDMVFIKDKYRCHKCLHDNKQRLQTKKLS